ncbi:MAG: hypothetical protein E4H14_14805 [Candidatus Thorarchaeota archaeon]|nr:MAG: hypothetical protein E4H14_14805 [Candidatus Thorarchaeota archaeon]
MTTRTHSEYMTDLNQQIDEAKKRIRQMKRIMPGLYPEHSEYMDAKRDLERARKRFKNANQDWTNLGK